MYDPTAVAYLLAPQMFQETRTCLWAFECAGALTPKRLPLLTWPDTLAKPNTNCMRRRRQGIPYQFIHQIQKCSVSAAPASAVEGVLLD